MLARLFGVFVVVVVVRARLFGVFVVVVVAE